VSQAGQHGGAINSGVDGGGASESSLASSLGTAGDGNSVAFGVATLVIESSVMKYVGTVIPRRWCLHSIRNVAAS